MPNLLLASSVIVPELDTAAVQERHKEAIDGRGPLKAALWQIELFNHQRMQKPGKICAWRHSNAREWLFDGAGAADSFAAFEYEHSLTRSRQVSGARQSIVARTDYNHIPGTRGNFLEWKWKTDFSQDCCCRGHTGSIYVDRPIANRKCRVT